MLCLNKLVFWPSFGGMRLHLGIAARNYGRYICEHVSMPIYIFLIKFLSGFCKLVRKSGKFTEEAILHYSNDFVLLLILSWDVKVETLGTVCPPGYKSQAVWLNGSACSLVLTRVTPGASSLGINSRSRTGTAP